MEEFAHGCAIHLEGFSQGQPRQHSGQGVPGDRVCGSPVVQPAARGVSDADSAEEVVSPLRARSHQRRDRQGLRVREGPLRRGLGRGLRQGHRRIDAGDQPRAVRRRWQPRPDVRGQVVLPGARRCRRRGSLRGDARRHARQGRHRQGRAVRSRVPGRCEAPGARSRDVHAAPRRGDSRHRSGRGSRLGPEDRQAGRAQARQAGRGDVFEAS